MPPGASDEQIVRVEVVDMGPTLLVLVIGQHGRVDKQIVDRPERMDAATVGDAERRLQAIRGLTYADAQARLLRSHRRRARDGARPAADGGRRAAVRLAGRPRRGT